MGATRARKGTIDMTNGSIVGSLFRFALPLLLGNLFQQLYNMVDTWVIGQTPEAGAYAAVGSVGPVINILIGFFSGLASGAGVVISQYYGAGDRDRVRRAVHTSILMTVILVVLITVLGVLFTPWILRLMLESEGDLGEVYPYAKSYLTIYFAGVAGLLLYNMGAGILRAIGDSDRPFYYLVVAAFINVGLDLLFVMKLGWGVAGVAYATIIAQGVSAVLTLITLFTTKTCVRLSLREMKMDLPILLRTVRIGIPAALQMAITAFSNVFVQSYIAGADVARPVAVAGTEQASVLGGWTTYGKVDQFIFLPLQSLALAATTFVGQNLGCKNVARAKRGTRIAYLMATVVTLCFMPFVMIFAEPIAHFFKADPDVVYHAVLALRYLTPFYLFCCVNQIFAAAMRGAGNSRAPMFIMLGSFVGFRQLYLFIVSRFISNGFLAIGFGYPAGWACCCLFTLLYYFLFFRYEKADILKEHVGYREPDPEEQSQKNA